jgi:tryptophan synthase beta subunit
LLGLECVVYMGVDDMARQHARIVELTVSYRPRNAGRSKVGGTLRGTVLATYRILHTTLRYAGG